MDKKYNKNAMGEIKEERKTRGGRDLGGGGGERV